MESTESFKISKLKKTTFHYVGSESFKDNFKKWDLLPTSIFLQYRYEESFKPLVVENFLMELFNSSEFKGDMEEHFKKSSKTSKYGLFFQGDDQKKKVCVTKENLTKLSTEVVNLEFFDRFFEHGIVHERTKKIKKCMEIYAPPLSVSDELRKYFLAPYSTSISSDFEDELFSEVEQNEFIFHLMKRIVTGGAMNQYEDKFDDYLESTKKLYKDFVSVAKDKVNGGVLVTSHVWSVANLKFFHPKQLGDESEHDKFHFCYVAVDDPKKRISVWYFYYRDLF